MGVATQAPRAPLPPATRPPRQSQTRSSVHLSVGWVVEAAAAVAAVVVLRLPAAGMPGLLGLCLCLASAAMAAYPTPPVPRVLIAEKPGRNLFVLFVPA
jgi:hypothetical protein